MSRNSYYHPVSPKQMVPKQGMNRGQCLMEDWSRTYILFLLSSSIEKIGGKNQNWIWDSQLQKSKYEQLVFLLATPPVKMAASVSLGAAHQEIVEGSQEMLFILLCPELHEEVPGDGKDSTSNHFTIPLDTALVYSFTHIFILCR